MYKFLIAFRASGSRSATSFQAVFMHGVLYQAGLIGMMGRMAQHGTDRAVGKAQGNVKNASPTASVSV